MRRFDDAGRRVFEQARTALERAPRQLVLDPLIDARTGAQTRASAALGQRLLKIAAETYPELVVRPFSARNLSEAPLLLMGTLNPANAVGGAKSPAAPGGKANGARANAGAGGDAYGTDDFRLLLALVDIGTGRSVAGTLEEATGAGLDTTALPFYRDSPTWHRDRLTDAYVRSTRAGLKPGEAIEPLYLMRLPSAAFAHEAVEAYGAGRWADALAGFGQMDTVAEYGDLRALNGLYLGAVRVGRLPQARVAMARIVETGLDRRQLPLRVTLPRSGSAAQLEAMWLQQAARGAVRKRQCLHVALPDAFESTPTAAERRRAEAVRAQLVAAAPQLRTRVDTDRPLLPEATLPAIPVDPARPGVELRVVDCR